MFADKFFVHLDLDLICLFVGERTLPFSADNDRDAAFSYADMVHQRRT